MITLYYFDLLTFKSEKVEFDYPEEAVKFAKKNKGMICITSLSCMDSEDFEYISTRV